MDSKLAWLKEEVEVILANNSDPYTCRNACQSLFNKLNEISSVETLRFSNISDHHFDNGKAINPIDAAHCMIDYKRTMQFMLGLAAAIEDKLKTKGKDKIHICYAGTGPFAPLLIPSVFKFSADDIEFTLMEIYPETQVLLTNTISQLGIEPWIKQVLKVDASKYVFPNDQKPDIVITETMQLALRKEMQVPITFNLYPQLKEGGIFLPTEIIISIVKLNEERQPDPDFNIPLMRFTPGSKDWINKTFEPVTVSFDGNSLQAMTYYYGTEITIYTPFTLIHNQSALTMPLYIRGLEAFKAEGTVPIQFQYQVSEEPGFRFTKL